MARGMQQESISALNDQILVPLSSYDENGGLGIQISGTFVGTLIFEMSLDGVRYEAVAAVNVTTGALESTATSQGIFRAEVVGPQNFRIRASAWTSGTATVTTVWAEG